MSEVWGNGPLSKDQICLCAIEGERAVNILKGMLHRPSPSMETHKIIEG